MSRGAFALSARQQIVEDQPNLGDTPECEYMSRQGVVSHPLACPGGHYMLTYFGHYSDPTSVLCPRAVIKTAFFSYNNSNLPEPIENILDLPLQNA